MRVPGNNCAVFLVFLFSLTKTGAQVSNPYHLNGNAIQENCNCYTLTTDHLNQSGSVWNINKIDLSESFDFKFNIFLGCKDDDGADGIVFVLQPISTSIGTQGGGLGYAGVSPSIGIPVDTWQNGEHNDPVYDHISIHKNGMIVHSNDDVAKPVPALASGGNIEDCKWHTLRIVWDASTNLLKAEIDGVDRVEATIDMVKDVFSDNPMVFWGFTSATGGAANHQRVCTSLNPGFYLPEDQTTCFPEPVRFIDSSHSFGTIDKWFWDFGDGTTSIEPQPGLHHFPAPGNYKIKLAILGNNGCLSDTLVKTVVIGSIPEAAFTWSPAQVCEGRQVSFLDSSYVEYGTVSEWNWSIGTENSNAKDPPPVFISGTNTVELVVGTLEGCTSVPVSSSLTAYPVPSVDFGFDGLCITEPALFTATNATPSIGIRQWNWNFGDGETRSGAAAQFSHQYKNGGEYEVVLTAMAANGCPSDPVSKTLNLYATNANAGNDTVVARNQPLSLNGTGGDIYQWSPATGLNAGNIPNPVAILERDQEYVLTVSVPAGCPTSDTVNVKVYKGPDLYVPSAFTPNNDGKNDRFKFLAVGMASVELFRIYNRYGQLVYSSSGTHSGWDGKLNGYNQPSGTYVWMIKGKDYTGISHFRKGTVTLVR